MLSIANEVDPLIFRCVHAYFHHWLACVGAPTHDPFLRSLAQGCNRLIYTPTKNLSPESYPLACSSCMWSWSLLYFLSCLLKPRDEPPKRLPTILGECRSPPFQGSIFRLDLQLSRRFPQAAPIVACTTRLMGYLPSYAHNLFVLVWVMDILQWEVPRNVILLPCWQFLGVSWASSFSFSVFSLSLSLSLHTKNVLPHLPPIFLYL